MSDTLKDKIAQFLAMCLKSQSETGNGNPITVDDLTEEQHREIAENAIAITNSLLELQRLLPLSRKLAELGHILEIQGKITVRPGEAYDEAALNYFTRLYGGDLTFSKILH